MDRWATFDCYGTLIDWNGGIGRELERLFGAEQVARLLHGYHEVEQQLQRERPEASYREVLTVALARLAEREDVPLAIVASEIGSYKPRRKHWETFEGQTGVPRSSYVHVGASLYHDIAPATELGLPTVWVNRLGEHPKPHPDVELHSLAGLGAALDSLVPGTSGP